MARIRSLKPEFWIDLKVGECSPNARLLFLATWNFADDHGGLDRSAKQLKAQAFPYDAIDCEPLIQELLAAGLLLEYVVDGNKYLHIKNFRKHQRIDKPQNPRVPLYEHSENVPRTLPEDSPTIQRSKGRDRKVEEGKGMEKEKTKKLEVRASRLPSDFTLTLDRIAVAKTENVDPERTFAMFTDYWRAASGAKARKLDWDATWRNWCRNQHDRGGGKTGPPRRDAPTADEIEARERQQRMMQ